MMGRKSTKAPRTLAERVDPALGESQGEHQDLPELVVVEPGKPAVPAASLLGPSPNPATNLAIADIALRSGTMVARRAIERALLGRAYTPRKASSILNGRTMAQILLHRSIARMAMGSVPGALAVGGTLLAKTLYERRQAKIAAARGARQLEKMAKDGAEED
ncbi:hypothetical protein HT136_21245 [Novosphingobium profundi]|uniref:hypothetical protein n=1 Tax=Novosphingobium profundi TaxID=1774954 RepID=UPI001BDACB18|nr:hypothetical protein [Novosphingobium profundi]MBT0670899.1 hypothetical protein [Novosphingobium profundi]